MNEPALRDSWRLAALAAVATQAPDGGVIAEVVTPLAAGTDPVVALSYDRSDLAQALRHSGQALLVCWDSRMAESGWRPVAATAVVEVIEDRDGDWVASGLLQQELMAHPPSRALLDTPLLRRENWWYVPRWIVRATEIDRTWGLGRREGADSGLLMWDDVDGLRADVVTVDDWDTEEVAVRSTVGTDLAHALGPAALLATDVRTPDLDHTAELRLRGQLRGSAVHVTDREGAPVLGEPPGLWRRLQRVRRLERDCRRNMRT
ncbi:hypothetical protein BH23ACT9_BH23ACT9_33040 [soil metagenome]